MLMRCQCGRVGQKCVRSQVPPLALAGCDVHWVMPFWGDYTIHGAYWRPRFGVPGSDGCVSMSDADAKSLFDWADVGTPVVIHS